jgi:regulator of sigma E protease
MTTIISFICVLGFLIFVHELGHYLAARWVGVQVIEFSIGFPPRMVSKLVGKTRYMISWLPLGGYVRLKGQDIDDEDVNDPENYASKTILQRFFILVAGPLMNVFVALLLMPIVYWIGYDIPAFLVNPPIIENVIPNSVADHAGLKTGDQIISIRQQEVTTWKEVQELINTQTDTPIKVAVQRELRTINTTLDTSLIKEQKRVGWGVFMEPRIGYVLPGSPASRAGLLVEDRIISINDQPVKKWSEISPLIQSGQGGKLQMVVERGARLQNIILTPQWNENRKYWTIGVNSPVTTISESFINGLRLGTERNLQLVTATLSFLVKLFSGKATGDNIGGPIMIAKIVGQAAKSGVSDLINLIAFISIQLGIFNLLPIPALDGGHIFFLLLEKIKGSPLSKKIRLTTQKIGFSLLITMILYISLQDSLRLLN